MTIVPLISLDILSAIGGDCFNAHVPRYLADCIVRRLLAGEHFEQLPSSYRIEAGIGVLTCKRGKLIFDPFIIPSDLKGPGTELKKLLERFWVRTGNCKCAHRAIIMNRWGPDRCELEKEIILGWLQEEARKRWIPFVESVARSLVNRAIANARKQALIP